MKVSKKELQLKERLSKFDLTKIQNESLLKEFKKNKDLDNCISKAKYFNDINNKKIIRQFKIVFIDDCNKKRGIYKLSFDQGDGFYIGRSKYIETRFRQHSRCIHKYFLTGEYKKEDFMGKIFDYLNDNPMAYYFKVELLEECLTVDELCIKEQKWLDKYKDNPNCLNSCFVAKKPSNELDESFEDAMNRRMNTKCIKRNGKYLFVYPKKAKVLSDRQNSVKKSTNKKKESAQSFSFNLPESNSNNDTPVVFKLYYGEKYIIHKGKYLAASIKILERNCGYYIAYNHDKKDNVDYYEAFYNYVKKNPNLTFRVEVIKHDIDAFEILKTEHILLNNSIRDKNCKNNNLTPYIPKFNEKTGMYNWIKQEELERYYEFAASI